MAKLHQSASFALFASIVLGASVFTGCSKGAPQNNENIGQNLVQAGSPSQDLTIESGNKSFRVMAQGALHSRLSQGQIESPQSVEGKAFLEKFTSKTGNRIAPELAPGGQPQAQEGTQDPSSLVAGLPVSMLGQKYVFGAVITKVSDTTNENLGDMKLTSLPPFNVTIDIAQDPSGNYALVLAGCPGQCAANSQAQMLEAFPIVGVDQANNKVMIDLSSVAKDLDLLSIMDPKGEATHLTTQTAKTVAFDYSDSTLVFDVESDMVPVTGANADPTVRPTTFTSRWFLRPASIFDPHFVSRKPTAGVGFFETDLSAVPLITRWSIESFPLHYYVKNVPARYQAAFASAFDQWNAKLGPIVGRKVFTYEFIPPGDPRNQLLVTGDPRYNIVEWDRVNLASYGGLGPSLANQETGEHFDSDVMIQGPMIEKIYKSWFKVNAQAEELRAQGQAQAADLLMIESRHEIFQKLDDLASRPELALTAAAGRFAFKVNSQARELADPLAERIDFEPLPPNMDYDQYMYGYFHDMLTHELGHDLGLRHNFKGNLGSTGDAQGEVSRSVMEYLDRDHRNLDGVDVYDMMALSYGYKGMLPTHTDWFCTDEDQGSTDNPTQSAECTENDATADPFSWYQQQLQRAVNYLVNRGSADAPTWTVDDMTTELTVAIQGMGLYASSAAATASSWTNFFNGSDRPQSRDASAIQAYVVEKLKAQLCDPSLAAEVASKSTPQAQAKTQDNITGLRAAAASLLAPLRVITADQLKCD